MGTTCSAQPLTVAPLRACALCMHSRPRADGELCCDCPAVRQVRGLQPVRVVRREGELCGLGARFMDMPGWAGAEVSQ